MTRGFLPLIAPLLFVAPADAQVAPVEGRWRVLVRSHDLAAETLRAELRLADSAGTLTGSLRLETDSGPPVPLSRITRPAEDALEVERLAQGPLTLTGRWTGLAWRGEVSRAGRRVGEWEAVALDPDEEFYPALPTFEFPQAILGTPAQGVRIPGPWLGAARARLAAGSAGPALDADVAARRLLGLEGREQWRTSVVSTLEVLRTRLSGSALARFDGVFEPARGWVADLHDAALRSVRRRRPGATWTDWAPALEASGLVGRAANATALMEAAWRLWVLGQSDTAALRLRLEAIRAADPTGGGIIELLQAYDQAAAWHAGATALLAGMLDPAAPAEGPTPVGEPLATPVNWEGERWLARHGAAGLARAVARLEPAYGEAASVDLGQGRVTLTTPAAEIAAGRLGPGSAMRLEPGEAPLLAAIRIVMARERMRLLSAWRARPAPARPAGMRFLPDPEPHLAAGLAELAADRAAAGLPFLDEMNELRRALDITRNPGEPARLGHALVEALVDGLGHRTLAETRAEIVALGYELEQVTARPELARAWQEWRQVPAEELPAGRGPVLVPRLRFGIEGGEPIVSGIHVEAFE